MLAAHLHTHTFTHFHASKGLSVQTVLSRRPKSSEYWLWTAGPFLDLLRVAECKLLVLWKSCKLIIQRSDAPQPAQTTGLTFYRQGGLCSLNRLSGNYTSLSLIRLTYPGKNLCWPCNKPLSCLRSSREPVGLRYCTLGSSNSSVDRRSGSSWVIAMWKWFLKNQHISKKEQQRCTAVGEAKEEKGIIRGQTDILDGFVIL